jgi:hypothetical protein
MSRFLKSPEETVWQALSRQERRAYDRYANLLSAQALAIGSSTEEMHNTVTEAHRHWRRTVRECDAYLSRNPEAYGVMRTS